MTSEKVKMGLLALADYKRCVSFDHHPTVDKYHSQNQDVECAICFKNISNKVFVCSEPCNKTFHPDCLEKMIDQLEETAWEEEKPTDYRCCYCRREFDFRFYQNEIFGRYLLGLKAGGYNVSDAMWQLQKQNNLPANMVGTGASDEEDTDEFEIYLPMNKTYIKKPKQAKRAVQKGKKTHQFKVKQYCVRR
jgi:hypothetical protein